MPTFEVALPIGAIAFYLYDCTMLLFGNELVYARNSGRWEATGGFDLFVFGKRLCIAWPFAPRALIFRVTWSENDGRTALPEEWPGTAVLQAIKPMQYVCSVLHFMLLVLLPLLSIFYGAGAMLLALFGAFYLLIIIALVFVYRRRDVLELRGKAFWMLALDVIACPPFAVNIVRKITLPLRLETSPLEFASHVFGPADWQRLVAVVKARVDQRLAIEELNGEGATKLAAFRERLVRDRAI